MLTVHILRKHILFYEDMVSAGAVLGNLFQIFEVHLPGRSYSLGYLDCLEEFCWMLGYGTEILNVFPIFVAGQESFDTWRCLC